jgi:hypothetical protein
VNYARFNLNLHLRPLILALSCVTTFSANAQTPPQLDTLADTMEECIRNSQQEMATKLNAKLEFNDYTASYVSAWLSMWLSGSSSNEIEMDAVDMENLCKLMLDDYSPSIEEVAKDRNLKGVEILAPVGGIPIEAESLFISVTNNWLFKHHKGHSDLTAEAWKRKTGLSSTSNAGFWISRASQTPDLYRWRSEKYHAHTPEYDYKNGNDRAVKIEDGISVFREQLTQVLKEIRQDAKSNSIAEAIFRIGIGAHLVQDLVFHRGITLRQHSGLAYALGKNPDYQQAYLIPTVWNDAVVMTERWIQAIKNSLSGDEWNTIVAWEPNGNIEFMKLAKLIFDSPQDISVRELVKYYELSLVYRAQPDRKSELEWKQDCQTGSGLPCWDTSKLVEDILPIKK